MEKSINPIKVSSGKIIRYKNFSSKHISSRFFDVWLPDDYNENKKYNLLIMHDGQLLFDSTYSWNDQEWCVDEWMEKLLKAKKIKETIVVGVWNSGKNRHTDYFPNKPLSYESKETIEKIINESKKIKQISLFNEGVKSDEYLKFIVKELIPFLEEEYSLIRSQENRYIGGSSMGGLISFYALCEYPKVFKGAICMSTHWLGDYPKDDNILPNTFFKYLKDNLPMSSNHKLYFDYGSEGLDKFYAESQKVVDDIYKRKGYTKENFLTMHFPKHGHQEKYWSKRLNFPLEFMLGI